MKKLLLILIVTIIVIAGCTKFEEGPKISFRTMDSRIIGSWEVTEYSCDGVDSLQFYKDSCGSNLQIKLFPESKRRNYLMSFYGGKNEFNAKGEFPISYNYRLNVKSGIFYYTNYITGPFAVYCNTIWYIIRLTKKELKINIDFDNRKYKMSFKRI